MKKPAFMLLVSLASACGATVARGPGVSDGDGGVVVADTGVVGDTGVFELPDVTVQPDTGVVTVDGGVPVDVVMPPPSRDAGTPVPCPGTVAGDGLACASVGMGCGSAGGPCLPSVGCSCGPDLRWHCTESIPDCRDAGPPPPIRCPGTPDGTGLPCASPGTGCGGATPCGGSFMCACGADRQWSCSGTVGICDAGPPPPPPPSDGGVCSLESVWVVRIMGITVDFRFQADGQWQAATSVPALDTSPATGGTYSVAGGRITLRETGGGGVTGCSASAEGVYGLLFAPDCRAVGLMTVSEACTARGAVLSGAVFTRP